MSNAWMWCLVPLAPLIALALFMALGNRVRHVTWLCCLPALLVALMPPPPAASLPFLWPGAAWGGAELVTRVWLGFTGGVWAAAALYATASQAQDERRHRFWTFWLLALCGNLLLILARDGLSFYVGFTLMSLCAYGLVVHAGGPAPRRAGRLYLQLAVTGEFAVLAGLMLRAHAAGGGLQIDQWQTVPLDSLSVLLLLIGFGLKVGFWPLHVWLPQAHPAAPAPASAVLSGAMLKAGVLGLWRFLPAGDPLLLHWAQPLMLLGLFTAFYGVAFGLISTKAKTTLAYSSISQMGYFLMILGLAWRHPEQGANLALILVLFAAHHAAAKGALFLAAGLVGEGRFAVKGYGLVLWWTLLSLPILALAGLPATSGAAAKTALKKGLEHSDFEGLLLVVTLASGGTMLLLLRAAYLLWRKHGHAPDRPMPRLPKAAWLILTVTPVVLPWLWPEMRKLVLYGLTWSHAWALAWPALVALALAGAALYFGWRAPKKLVHLPNPALIASLMLKRLAQRPPLPPLKPPVSRSRWRQRERKWNRFWQSGSVMLSGWLIALLLVLASFW